MRVAILAAALCPALSALGGSVVAALLAATGRLAGRAEKADAAVPLAGCRTASVTVAPSRQLWQPDRSCGGARVA